PLAVPLPLMSRQRPSVRSAPFDWWNQCWSTAYDWQSHSWMAVRLPPLSSPATSTHLPPGAVVTPPPFTANFCAAAPLQSQSCSRVPLPVLPFGESRQRPDCGLRSEPSACEIHF